MKKAVGDGLQVLVVYRRRLVCKTLPVGFLGRSECIVYSLPCCAKQGQLILVELLGGGFVGVLFFVFSNLLLLGHLDRGVVLWVAPKNVLRVRVSECAEDEVEIAIRNFARAARAGQFVEVLGGPACHAIEHLGVYLRVEATCESHTNSIRLECVLCKGLWHLPPR